MKNFEFNFDTLKEFSASGPYLKLDPSQEKLLSELESFGAEINFPHIHKDIGSFIAFMMPSWSPEYIFEMGSGYGHSAFWYFYGQQDSIKEVTLTEKRSDLVERFNSLPWPKEWSSKMSYHQKDAFEVLKSKDRVDLALIDGVKANYLDFLQAVSPKMSPGGIVIIDNSYWRGSFLDKELSKTKESARKIKELHEFISSTADWTGVFIPYIDGLSILRRC